MLSRHPPKNPTDAGAPEIEVTADMIDAGAKEFLHYSGGCEVLIGNERTAAYSIFTAMVAASPLLRTFRILGDEDQE